MYRGKRLYLEADHGTRPRYPVGEGDEWLIWQEWNGLFGCGIKFITAIPRQAFHKAFTLEQGHINFKALKYLYRYALVKAL